MPTVHEVLKASGMTDEQITALDAKVMGGFTTILSTAEQAREAAELAQRKTTATIQEEINPALDKWATESATLTAERDYYKTLAEKAKEGGFVPGAAPFAPAAATTRDPGGRFVPNANPVPGSPQYMTKAEGFTAVTSATWYISEYMRLHNGAPPPDDITVIAREADEQKIPFKAYVEKKYDFQAKREKIRADERKKEIDAATAAAVAENDKKWAEKIGTNPNIRAAETSRFSEINKAVADKSRPDPLTLTKEQRHAA